MEEPTNALLNTVVLGVAFKVIRNWNLEFISDTKDIDYAIDNLFNESKYYLYIVTPYFLAGENRLKSIIDAKKRGCMVIILIHRNALNEIRTIDELKRLKDIGCRIFIHSHLHSKIYLNEQTAITGSANLLKGSFDNSLEMGVESSNVDHLRQIHSTIIDYFDGDSIEEFNPMDMKMGYCIKTKQNMNYNTTYPIKYDVYKASEDKTTGKYCHSCGNEAETTTLEPLCSNCK